MLAGCAGCVVAVDVVEILEVLLVVARSSDHESSLTMRFSSIWALAMPK